MTTSGWVRCSARSDAWIAAALRGMSRRRARLSARADLAKGQLRRARRVGCPGQQFQGIGVRPGPRTPPGRRGSSRAARAAIAARRGCAPRSLSCASGSRPSRPRPASRVTRDRPQLVEARADHVGQHVRVRRVALRARQPRASLRCRAACSGLTAEHRVAGRRQRPHPRAPVSLDPDPAPAPTSASLTKMLADHRMQPGHTGDALAQPRLRQPTRPDHVLNLNIVVSPQPSHPRRTAPRPPAPRYRPA